LIVSIIQNKNKREPNMAFFDKKQDVIDIKLTQFGKNLLARGGFRPVYYRFFDDGILYNSEKAGFTESQNRSTLRIEEAQRLRTQYLIAGVETRFDFQQDLIESGTISSFIQSRRKQDPLIAEKICKYPLYSSRINSAENPSFTLNVVKNSIENSRDTLNTKGILMNTPQLNFTSSYELVVDRRKQKEVPDKIMEQYYMDLVANEVEFLDKSKVVVRDDDIVIDLVENGVFDNLQNFEIEIFEIDEKDNMIRLQSKEEVEKYFEIKTDDSVQERPVSDVRDPRFRNGGPRR